MDNFKQHPIVDRPWEFRIVKFVFDSQSTDFSERFIELWLQKGMGVRKLKFFYPTQLMIEEGFPNPTHGMEILDIENQQMENINIRVSDFESSWGRLTFYAKSVEEII